MRNIEYKWLTLSDMADYGQLCVSVEASLKATGTEVFMDFLTVPQCHTALEEGRVAALYSDGQLAATIIAEYCFIAERIKTRFDGAGLDELDLYGVYLRNGMVAPAHQGQGLYSLLMKHVVDLHEDEPIAGTMNILNLGPQRACAAAGLLPTGKLIRTKDGVETLLYSRLPIADAQSQTEAA